MPPRLPASLPVDAGPARTAAAGAADEAGIRADTGNASSARTRIEELDEELSPVAAELLASARGHRRGGRVFAVLAEVLELGPVETAPLDQDRLQQRVRLRLLEDPGRGIALQQFQIVVVPHCPTISVARFGCSLPLGALAPGQVREAVLSPPSTDYRSSFLAGDSLWLVFAGPPVPRPPSALDVVPPALHAHLGRLGRSVFRARVRSIAEQQGLPGAERMGLPTSRTTLELEVLEVAQSNRYRTGEVARFVDGTGLEQRLLPTARCEPLPPEVLRAGAEAWFAADYLLLGSVVWAASPVSR